MDDFPNLTPPPERGLTPDQRDRMLGRLTTRTDDARARPWLLSGAAAAAVLLVIGGALMLSGAIGGGSPGAREVRPAGAGDPPRAPASAGPTGPQCVSASDAVGTVTRSGKTVRKQTDPCLDPGPAPSCRSQVDQQLPAAREVASGDDGVSFWQAGERWVLCYRGASVTTVQRVGTIGAAVQPRVRFGFSTDLGDSVAGHLPATMVAGGPLGGADSRISYTFPDGHQQDAVVLDGADGRQWWVLKYVATDGILADPGTDWAQLAPVVVTFYGTDVSTPDQVEIDWSNGGCAQANHGC